MKRREFLGLGVAAVSAILAPASLSAIDYRATKPDAWTAHNVKDAMKALYGTTDTIEKGVKITIPNVAANGGAIPVNIKSDIDGVSVALFQDANPESAVAVWTLNENSIINFDLKIKMKASGSMTAVVEGKDGKLYSVTKSLEVALGGCEG
jgi:sulfur-oxidizing protein SoxY